MKMKMFCLTFCLLLAGCSRSQMYYIRDAQMVPFSEGDEELLTGDRSEPTKLLLNGHYIESGDNLVLLIRKFDKGATFAIDDEGFEKLTIEVKNYTVGVPIYLESHDINLYYSSGGSAWIYRGLGVYSASGSGNLIIRRIEGNSLTAEINLTMSAKSARSPLEGEEVRVRDVFVFTQKRLEELTPWLGVPDANPGNEVYPWPR